MGALFRVNGTAVPDGITFRPFSPNFDGYKFGRAGGWALQSVVTRLNLHWPTARRQSNANIALTCCSQSPAGLALEVIALSDTEETNAMKCLP